MQKEEPSAIYVHCLAHCINLCLQVLGRQVAPVRDSLELVREVSQLIRFSPKRLSLFESMQSQLSHSSPSPSLKPLCPTRWTVRTGAINAVLANYEAGGILHAMEKFCTFFGLHLSHLVFSATEQLSLRLQGKDTTPPPAPRGCPPPAPGTAPARLTPSLVSPPRRTHNAPARRAGQRPVRRAAIRGTCGRPGCRSPRYRGSPACPGRPRTRPRRRARPGGPSAPARRPSRGCGNGTG